MLQNFILESYRNKKHRPFSFIINWLGLTLGFAAVIVMYLYIVGEVNHDKECFTTSMDNVYRCEMGDSDMGSICPSALRPFVETMAEVQSATRAQTFPIVVATEGLSTNKRIKLNVMSADSTVLDVLPFKIVAGDGATALSGKENIIISRSAAVKLYDTEDVIGRIVKLNNTQPATIVAVMEDIPENSSFYQDIICNIEPGNIAWSYWASEVYLRVRDNVDRTAFEVKYANAVKDEMLRVLNTLSPSEVREVRVRPFNECYLAVIEGLTMSKSIDPADLTVLGLVALLILVIAIINYVNIYTARSTEVIRAMGVKSIMGAARRELITFVIFDSVVITLLSALTGFFLAWELQPVYHDIIGSQVSFSLEWYSLLILFVGLPLVCGVISGLFPAFTLTCMKPLDAIANRNSGGRQMIYVRNTLIVFQFTITIALIASTIYINKQMKFMSDMNPGYSRDNIYTVDGGSFMFSKYDTFRNALLRNPGVKSVAFMQNSPINVGSFTTVAWGETRDEQATINVMHTDENALNLLGVRMVEGDSLSPSNAKTLSYNQVMINETFANQLRATIPDLKFPYKNFIGVFKDFQFTSFDKGITPLGIGSIHAAGGYGTAYIKLAGDSNLEAMLKFINSTFDEIYPDEMYEASFLDDQFDQMYNKEKMFGSRLLTFSILAIFIGCLGLLALVSYSVERRRREIAIRKVYGSSVAQIMLMLGSGFGRLLVVSFVIAVPLVLYAMTSWVEQFAYRSPISWWIFAVALIAAVVVAGCTIFYMTYRAATENPAESVKA